MNQQEHISQLSALFDNELSPDQAELVIRRALKDPAMRTSWGRYALIGACVRGEPLAGRLRPESDVAARVRIRLAVESSRAAGQGAARDDVRPRTGTALLARGAMAMAIAASVAAVSLFLVRFQAPQTGTMIAQSAVQDDRAALVAIPAATAAGAATQWSAPHRRPWLRQPALRPVTRRPSTIRRSASAWMGAWSITWSRTVRFPRRPCVSVPCRQ